MASAQAPEIAIARIVALARPSLSPSTPPSQHPTAPMPMTAKVAMVDQRPAAATPCRLNVSPRNTETHAHMA